MLPRFVTMDAIGNAETLLIDLEPQQGEDAVVTTFRGPAREEGAEFEALLLNQAAADYAASCRGLAS